MRGRDGKGQWTAGRSRGGRGDAGREGGTCGRESERHREGRRGRRALYSEPEAARRRLPGHRPPRVPAQVTRPPIRGADRPTEHAECRRRPAMFSRSSRKRLSSRSVSVPHQSGTDLRVPLGRRGRPCPVSQCPAAAHLWPQVSRPRGRAGGRAEAWPEREGSKAQKGLSPDSQTRREGDQKLWPAMSQFGGVPESPLPRLFL